MARQGNVFSWFANGILLSVLLMAAMNSISFFVRSGSWRPLVEPAYSPQAIGFPFEIWRLGQNYGVARIIDVPSMIMNIGVALLLGVVFGIIFSRRKQLLEGFMQFMIECELSANSESNTWQFSVGGMLIFSAVASVIAAAFRAALGASPILLLGIYAIGPAFLVALSMIPKGLSWQKRVVLLTPSTLILIGFAMFVGSRLQLPFEHVMMGVFVCWVPQTIAAAIILMARSWFQFRWHQSNETKF